MDWAIPVADLTYDEFSLRSTIHTVADNGDIYVVGDFFDEFGLANYAETLHSFEEEFAEFFPYNGAYMAKFSASGQILWLKHLITVEHVGSEQIPHLTMKGIEIDNSGNLIVTGVFYGQIDLNPDPNQEDILTQNAAGLAWGVSSVFVAKYSADADFVWANKIESEDSDWNEIITNVAINSGDDIIIGTSLTEAGVILTMNDEPIVVTPEWAMLSGNFALIKLNEAGQLIWAGFTESPVSAYASVKSDGSDNIYLFGNCSGSSDLDPGDGIVYPGGVAPDNNSYRFILKLNNAGEYLWSYCMTINSGTFPGYFNEFNDLAIDSDGNIVAVGNHVSSLDFDAGAGVVMSESEAGGFILKVTSAGEFNSYRPLPLAKFESMAIGSSDEMYLSGFTTVSTDFDPSDDEFSLAADVGFIAKYGSDGTLIYAKDFGDLQGTNGGSRITVTSSDELIYTATSTANEINFEDFGSSLILSYTNAAGQRPLIFKLGTSPCQGFIANIDENENVVCGEEDSGYASVSVIGGNLPYNFSWSGAPEALTHELYTNSTGIYTVTVTEAGGCSHTMSTLINGPANGGLDYQVLPPTFTSSDMFVPGLETTVGVTVKNMSCDTDATLIKVVLEGDITFVSSTITPTSIVGDTLFFNSEQINYSNDFHTSVVVTTNTTAQMGDLVCVEVIVDSQDDINSENNYAQVCRNVLTSYDPNAKSVYPVGACEENYVPLNQKLTYTAQFQNTGTFAAINVYMMDTLSQYLDISTLNILDKTHDMVVEIYEGNIVKFRFDNLWLADSTSNEAESHGHVIFEISPIETIASGTVVENNVAIYFDYNEPVITNTVRNTFVGVVPQCVVSVTESEIPSLLSAYPNPARDFVYIKSNDASTNKPVKLSVIDISGKVVLQDNAYMLNTTPLNVSTLAQGVYMITLSNEEGNSYARFVKE